MNRQQRRAAGRGRSQSVPAAPRVTTPSTVEQAIRHLGAERFEEAERFALRALRSPSEPLDARLVLVDALIGQGRLDEAMLQSRRAVAAAADRADSHSALGKVLLKQDRIVEAIAAFERAGLIDPDHLGATLGLGGACGEAGEHDRAIEAFERAVRSHPERLGGYAGLSGAQVAMGDFRGALRTVAAAPHTGAGPLPLVDALDWHRSLASLGVGDLETAWKSYEAGFSCGQRAPKRDLPIPSWNGEDLSGRSVVVWREQGIADEIMFGTCVPDLIDLAAEVVVEANPRLVTLLQRSLPRAAVVPTPVAVDAPPAIQADYQVSLGSLPNQLRPSLATFRGAGPYLRADQVLRENIRDRLAGLGSSPKVGISWRSMNLKTGRLAHYVTLDECIPFLSLPNVTFVNLQYGSARLLETELLDLEERTGIVLHRWDDIDYTDDIETVAALTAELDLVIGPMSFPTVMAGALGVPALVFNGPTPWVRPSGASLWFPRTRHFTRGWNETWADAMASVANALSNQIS